MDIDKLREDLAKADERLKKASLAYHSARNTDDRMERMPEKKAAFEAWQKIKKQIESEFVKVSNCCGAIIPIDGLDYGICPDCKEHCEFVNEED
jgi:hypothetical protein